MASVIKTRIAALEATQQRRTPRRGLSSERRKYLTDKAVAGDQEALQELNLHRPRIAFTNPEQRAAAVAAGLRANS
jgi:hypothetical protein